MLVFNTWLVLEVGCAWQIICLTLFWGGIPWLQNFGLDESCGKFQWSLNWYIYIKSEENLDSSNQIVSWWCSFLIFAFSKRFSWWISTGFCYLFSKRISWGRHFWVVNILGLLFFFRMFRFRALSHIRHIPFLHWILFPFWGVFEDLLKASRKLDWWFQPTWKILVKLDHFPKYIGVKNKKCLKPPTSRHTL